MPSTGPVASWKPPPPPPPPADLWREYLELLRQIKATSKAKRLARLEQNARGLALRLMQNYDQDIAAYPAVERTQFRDPC